MNASLLWIIAKNHKDTSALIVLSHNDLEVLALIVKKRYVKNWGKNNVSDT